MTTGLQIAHRAKEQLAQLTGLEADTVSGLEKKDGEGWHVLVNMIELKRIPDTTDVLATYHALMDDKGELISYRRTRRYFRDQVTEDSEET